MNLEYMREQIMAVYPGNRWAERCKAMGARQVVAIYHSFLNSGKFNKKLNPDTKEKPKFEGVQISMWDIIREEGRINNGI